MSELSDKDIEKIADRVITKLGQMVPPPIPVPFYSKPTCQKCGINLEGVMGYVCPHSDCPCGMGGTHC